MSNETKPVIYDDDNIKTLDSISAIRLIITRESI